MGGIPPPASRKEQEPEAAVCGLQLWSRLVITWFRSEGNEGINVLVHNQLRGQIV